MKLDYTIDMTEPENVLAVNDVFKDQPDPKVIIDMQQTLAKALQPVQVQQPSGNGPTAATPAAANWGNDNA